MSWTSIRLASFLSVCSLVTAAPPREAIPFNEVKPAGELRTRLAKNFERRHAERYRIDQLFTKSHDPKT
jgi:hypothetical protein